MSVNVKVISVGPMQMNAILLTTEEGPQGPEAILIDPGEEPERLIRLIEESGCRLTNLLATHGHFDHVGSGAAIQEKFDLPLRCHKGDQNIIENMPQVQAAYGFPSTPIPRLLTDLEHGGTIDFGNGKIDISHVPGHSPGQTMFSFEGYALVGDCLFAGSVGRTDLPGGDFTTLEKSIRERIYTLADDTVVVCGHGPDTTIGREKSSNPFVKG